MANLVETVPGGTPYKGREQITSLSSSTALTVPAGARWAIIQARTQAVWIRLDAAAATTAGFQLAAGQPMEITTPLADVRVIEAAASAVLDVLYFG